MENAIKCPVCKGKSAACNYCGGAGYVVYEDGRYFRISLDAKNNPVKGEALAAPPLKNSGNPLLDKLFSQNEPHDMIWFFKQKHRK